MTQYKATEATEVEIPVG